jgi:hypothetical protein
VRFWDASAVIPLCVDDPSTALVRRLAHEDPAIAAWWGTVVECCSALSRLRRQGDLTTADLARARHLLDRLAESWSEVTPSARDSRPGCPPPRASSFAAGRCPSTGRCPPLGGPPPVSVPFRLPGYPPPRGCARAGLQRAADVRKRNSLVGLVAHGALERPHQPEAIRHSSCRCASQRSGARPSRLWVPRGICRTAA